MKEFDKNPKKFFKLSWILILKNILETIKSEYIYSLIKGINEISILKKNKL